MAAPKRNKAQREVDLIRTAELYLEGHSVRVIARKLSAEREYSLTHVSIVTDIKLLLKRWRDAQLDDMDAALAAELARLSKLEVEAWEAWRRSQEDAVTVTEEDRTGRESGSTHRTQTAGQCGDPRFLAVIEKCVARRCSLLGLEDHVVSVRLSVLEGELGL